jgi:diphthamide synthase subunit DPH2
MKTDKENKKNSGITPNEKNIQELKTSTINELNNKLGQLLDILEVKEMGCITITKNEDNNISFKFSIIADQLPKEKIIHLINQTKKNVFLELPEELNKTNFPN